jgi:Tol biopolymer transport system component
MVRGRGLFGGVVRAWLRPDPNALAGKERGRRSRTIVAAFLVPAALFAVAAAVAQPGMTDRVSVSSLGEEGNDDSHAQPSISANGRFVAFSSDASNLVPADTNASSDGFVRDQQLGATERVSVSSLGEQGDGDSYARCISADGRFVGFQSWASNLVPGDTNGELDVFVRDRLMGMTERVSISSTGAQANSDSYGPSVSADGRYVAFSSGSSNLVPGDTSGYFDVFVRDRLTGTTEWVSLSSSGQQGDENSGIDGCSISADGRFVAFYSCAHNLVPGDTNQLPDVFVRDRQLGGTELVSISSAGEQGNSYSGLYGCCISADGRFVAFDSDASNLELGDTNEELDVFVRDRLMGMTERVSISSTSAQANDGSYRPCISADGRFVAFSSYASNLVPADTNGCADVFAREREADYHGVSGRVRFQNLDASAALPSMVGVRVTWNSWPFGSYGVDLAPDGAYSLLLPAGELTLSIKHTYWLRQTVSADNSAGPVSGVDFCLVNGDCCEDNAVDLRDLVQVLLHFGQPGGLADVDESGTVDLADLGVMLLNFGRIGDD